MGRVLSQWWVFGMVNLAEPTKPMLFYVPARNAATLMPLVQYHIPAGSTVVSDQWRAYNQIQRAGFLHLTVNHSRNFVDPNTGSFQYTEQCCLEPPNILIRLGTKKCWRCPPLHLSSDSEHREREGNSCARYTRAL